jgi:hypothetical protein
MHNPSNHSYPALDIKLMYKKLISFIFKITDSFNREWHANIERRIKEGAIALHSNEDIPLKTREEDIKKMREFYYTRMANSSNLLIAISSLFVSAVALIVAIIALRH